MFLLHIAVFIPFLFSAVLLVSRKFLESMHRGWLALPVPILLFVFFLSHIPQVQEAPIIHAASWISSLDITITFYLDGLSLLFALLISGIGLLVVLYSIYYLDEEKKTSSVSMHIFSCSWGQCLVLFFLIIYLFYMLSGR